MTRVALAQRKHLVGELAGRGIDCHAVVVADDENLDIAREHGFDTVEMDNDHGLGRRFNAGYQHAAAQGADYFVHLGSDDWLHPAVFDALDPDRIVAGRRIAFVDLVSGRLRRAVLDGPTGVIPWVIPRRMLERCDFAPIRPDRNKGMDGYLVRGLRQSGARMRWWFHDPHPYARVDFKSAVNLHAFEEMPGRDSPDAPWPALVEHYPAWLVNLARDTHIKLRGGPMPKMERPDGRVVSVSESGFDAMLTRGYKVVADEAPAAPAPVPVVSGGAPSPSALKAEWVAYALTRGVVDPGSLTKARLVELLA